MGSVMKDPEWPVYYFRQQAEGKHCCHQMQLDVRLVADVLNSLPAVLLPSSSCGKRRFLMPLLMEERLMVHRMIICSGLMFKTPKS